MNLEARNRTNFGKLLARLWVILRSNPLVRSDSTGSNVHDSLAFLGRNRDFMRRSYRQLVLFAFAGLLSFVQANGLADEGPTAAQLQFFESKIRPVLVRECYGCHSNQADQIRGGLGVDSVEAIRAGGSSGPAVVPGDLDESLLWNAINHVDFVMPPGRKLSANQLADFKTWIEMGAPDPRVTEEVNIQSTITDEDIENGRKFWAFQSPRRPDVPRVDSDWPKTEIDRFVYDKLNGNQLQPAPDANPQVLLRRLCFDLVGLPPTPEQLERFERDSQRDADRALNKMVNRLLAQPQFGERWGRHWLDVARYAESAGRELNATFPEAWRYRDYVIAAFNEDKPYDRFVQEQLAGDMLPVASDDERANHLIATGFLAIGPKVLTERNPRQFELDLVDEQIDVTTRVLLGVSVACARCHDHKFDPIPQADYYALAGIFRSMTTHYGTSRTLQNRRPSDLVELPKSVATPFHDPISREQFKALESELKVKQRELRESLQARRMRQAMPATPQPQNRIVQTGPASNAVAFLQSTIDSYSKNGRPRPQCMGVQESSPVTARLLERGEFNRPGQEVPRGFPQVLCGSDFRVPDDSTGRLEFAQWVGSSANPLTARVMVNRVWLHLLGHGIVRTPEDFASTGDAPTHPELLDYLAVEFMENGWSVQQLIRSIVLSRTYRMSSRFDRASFEADPENRFLWRVDPKRLDAEAIRDAMLAVSGQLELDPPTGSLVAKAGPAIVRDGRLQAFQMNDLEGSGGPQTFREQFQNRAGREATGSDLFRRQFQSLDEPIYHRSVYMPIVRDNIPRSLDVFDFAESSMVIGKRDTSTTAEQGLYFLNNAFVIEQADVMARRLFDESKDLHEQITRAFLLALSRRPNGKEIRTAKEFYRSYQPESQVDSKESSRRGDRWVRSAAPTRRGRRSAEPSPPIELLKLSALCQSLMAASEFRYVD